MAEEMEVEQSLETDKQEEKKTGQKKSKSSHPLPW